MPSRAQRALADRNERMAEFLYLDAVRLHEADARRHGGRCVFCRSDTLTDLHEQFPETRTPDGQACPLRHRIGQVLLSYRITSDAPVRTKNAVERRVWARVKREEAAA